MRTILTNNTTFYVNSLAPVLGNGSQTTPFKTLQYAHDYIQNNYDLAGFSVTFICQGTFHEGLNEQGSLVGQSGPCNQIYTFSNNSSVTGTSYGFNSSYGLGFILQSTDNLTISCPNGVGIATSSGSTIALNQGITIGSCTSSQLQTSWGGNIYLNCNIKFTGNAQQCLYASGGVIQLAPGITSTWIGTTTYSNCYAWAYAGGIIGINGQKFAGAVYGTQYKAELNGIIATGGMGPNYLPGNKVGGTSYGGIYW